MQGLHNLKGRGHFGVGIGLKETIKAFRTDAWATQKPGLECRSVVTINDFLEKPGCFA